MSVKITELPILSELADNDVIAGVDVSGNVTSKIEMETLKGYIDTNTQYTAGTNIDITNNVISAPDVPTKEEFDSLSTIFNAFPTESDEDESMTLDGTAEVKFKKFDLKGNTSQYSTTGKNIINYVDNLRTSYDGLTSVINKDGSITTTGIPNSDYRCIVEYNINSSLENGETYTLWQETPQAHLLYLQINAIKKDGTGTSYYSLNTGNNYIQIPTVNKETYNYVLNIQTEQTSSWGTSSRTITNKYMLEKGNKTSFEPYTGGTPSPNPSYPQDVNVVSGDNEINICGENLFHSDRINLATLSGITSSFDSSSLSLNGSNTSAGYVISNRTATNITLEAGTYYFTISLLSGSINRGSNQGEFTIKTSDGRTGITLSNIINSPSGYTKSFTATEKTTLETDFYLNGAITFTNVVLGIEISKQTPTTYEPYIGNTYNIDLPVENLFNKNGNLMLDYRLANDGGNFRDIGYYISEYIPISANTTYTKNSPTADYAHRVCFYSNNDTTNFISKSEDNTFTTPSNAKYLRFCGLQTEIDTTQLEVGSKQNNFTPYGTTPIELCKIGNYQDYIYKDSDKWYLHKEIVSFVFNGTENWSGYVDVSGSSGTIAQIGYNPGVLFKNRDGLSNRFEVIANYGATEHIVMAGSLRIIYAQIAKSRLSEDSLNGFKNWLSNNNTSFYGMLDTPTNTEITYQPLIDQLNELEKAMSKDGQTNISQVSNDKPFILDVTAIKSLQNVLDRIELLES